jgi:hypothetical protein
MARRFAGGARSSLSLISVPVATAATKANTASTSAESSRNSSTTRTWQLVIYPTIALWLLAFALFLLDRRGRTGRRSWHRRRAGRPVLRAATAQVTITGHSGDRRLELLDRLQRLQVARDLSRSRLRRRGCAATGAATRGAGSSRGHPCAEGAVRLVECNRAQSAVPLLEVRERGSPG